MQYELTLVLHPDLTENQIDDIIKKLGLDAAHKSAWGKRLLAYEINGHKEGLYIYLEINLGSNQQKTLSKSLNVHDEVIRYLLIKPDKKN